LTAQAFRVLRAVKPATQSAKGSQRREVTMGLLWFLVLLLIIFALVGGFAVNNWLFVILLIAIILLLVGYV
jgi:nitrate reductase NapE component